MKFPSMGAERLSVVAIGITSMWDRLLELENYADVIPHKRAGERNGPSVRKNFIPPMPSDPPKLHLVVGDAQLDLAPADAVPGGTAGEGGEVPVDVVRDESPGPLLASVD